LGDWGTGVQSSHPRPTLPCFPCPPLPPRSDRGRESSQSQTQRTSPMHPLCPPCAAGSEKPAEPGSQASGRLRLRLQAWQWHRQLRCVMREDQQRPHAVRIHTQPILSQLLSGGVEGGRGLHPGRLPSPISRYKGKPARQMHPSCNPSSGVTDHLVVFYYFPFPFVQWVFNPKSFALHPPTKQLHTTRATKRCPT